MVLELAGLGMDKQEEKTYSARDVLGEITPGRCLRGLRYREDLTQAEFARQLWVKQHHVSEMERDIRPISKAMAHKIDETFGISYKVFL